MKGRSSLILTFPEGSDLFSLFQISLENFFDIKFRLWYEHKIDPDWLESIPFYEYQIWIDKLNDTIEKKNTEAQAESGVTQLFNFSAK